MLKSMSGAIEPTEATRPTEPWLPAIVGIGVAAMLLGWLLAVPMEHSIGSAGGEPGGPDRSRRDRP